MDWSEIELRVFATDAPRAASGDDHPPAALVALPDAEPGRVELSARNAGYAIANDPFAGRVQWRITHAPDPRS